MISQVILVVEDDPAIREGIRFILKMSGERVIVMKQKERLFNPYGLRARLGWSLAISAVICLLVLIGLSTGLGYLLANYYDNSGFERIHFERQSENLQSYIDSNQISTQNLSLLKKWEKKQPIIFLQ